MWVDLGDEHRLINLDQVLEIRASGPELRVVYLDKSVEPIVSFKSEEEATRALDKIRSAVRNSVRI